IVPFSFGCGSAVFAAIATLAPSRAARNAIERPMPRLPPDTNIVLPFRDVIGNLQLVLSKNPLLCGRFRATRARIGCAEYSSGGHRDRIGRSLSKRLDHGMTHGLQSGDDI